MKLKFELDENPLEDLFNRPSDSPGRDMLGGSGILDPKDCPQGQEWDEDTQRCIAVVEEVEEEEVVEETIADEEDIWNEISEDIQEEEVLIEPEAITPVEMPNEVTEILDELLPERKDENSLTLDLRKSSGGYYNTSKNIAQDIADIERAQSKISLMDPRSTVLEKTKLEASKIFRTYYRRRKRRRISWGNSRNSGFNYGKKRC